MPATRREQTRRAPATTSAAALALLLITPMALAIAPATAPAASAAPGECTEAPPLGTYPGLGNVITYTDNNVAAFIGGDFVATGDAAESEGVMIVLGDAEFSASGTFNVGDAGAGSGITPSGGALMLGVGGNLTVNAGTVLHVGALHYPDGGDVEVGGIASPTYPSASYDLYGGVLTAGLGLAGATAPFTDFADTMNDISTDLGGRTPNGSVSFVGSEATFTGTNAAELQVFEITTTDLASMTEVVFQDVLDEAPVVINVTGAGPVTWTAPNATWNGTERADDFSSSDFGLVSARTLWNFVSASDVTITTGNQLLGTVIIPAADASIEVTASINGRVYVGGDLTLNGDGNELHNYPWFGFTETECDLDPTSSAFTIQKILDPASSGFDGTMEIAWDCGESGSGIVELAAGEVSSSIAMAVGSECTVSEPVLPVAPEGWEWGLPVISPASFTMELGSPVAVTVTNTLSEVGGQTEETPDDEESKELAVTGPERALPIALGGLGLLILGIGATILKRSRRLRA